MSNEVLDLEAFMRVPAAMTQSELEGFSTLLYSESGITLSPSKQHMVTARLSKRLRELKIGSYGEYLRYLTGPDGRVKELDHFIDVMTTNKTEFFRERSHFDTLLNPVLQQVRSNMSPGEDFVIWSAGCSTGEEPYSLAMLLYDRFLCVPENYTVLATDICKDALSTARKAVYSEDIVRPVPGPLAERFLLRGKHQHQGTYRVAPEIRQKVAFQRINLMDEVFAVDQIAHVIWCRNVMIYFDTPTKAELCRKFYRQLVPGGYLFIGHSESLNSISNEFMPVVPAVYRKPMRVRL